MDESLKIPDAAKAAAYAATVGIPTTFGLINTAINAAAPLIVAAELRRLAGHLVRTADRQYLIKRADELDPQRSSKCAY
jgi:hypothetical protein